MMLSSDFVNTTRGRSVYKSNRMGVFQLLCSVVRKRIKSAPALAMAICCCMIQCEVLVTAACAGY